MAVSHLRDAEWVPQKGMKLGPEQGQVALDLVSDVEYGKYSTKRAIEQVYRTIAKRRQTLEG